VLRDDADGDGTEVPHEGWERGKWLTQHEAHRQRIDRPLHEQCFAYLESLREGELGPSIGSKRPVEYDLAPSLPSVVLLAKRCAQRHHAG